MTSLPNTTRSILLVFGLLTSGSGCHVLNIPVDSVSGLGVHTADCECEMEGGRDSPGILMRSVGPRYPPVHGIPTRSIEPHHHSLGNACASSCPPDWLSPLPHRDFVGFPVPKWWADWKAKKDLPDPPAYPRFHPLPSRPMFQPRPALEDNQWGGNSWDSSQWGGDVPAPAYGQLPDTRMGRGVWQPESGTQ